MLHGHEVADPYRWLEAGATDREVAAFIDGQDAAARAHLAALPGREHFARRLRQLWNHPRRSTPWRRGGWWFQLRNDGLQEQDVLWRAPAVPDAPRGRLPAPAAWSVLLDPREWSADGTVALSGLATSDDGRRLAVGRSAAGSDWTTWRVVDVADATLHDDEVPWSKFGPAAWLPDGSGFLYTAYDPPAAGDEHAAANHHQQVRLHRVGTPATQDALVHAHPDQPEWGFHPAVSHDGRWLVLTVTRGTDPETGVQVAALDDSGGVGPVHTLLETGQASFEPLGVVGTELLLLTDQDAPLGRVVAVALPQALGTSEPGASGPRVSEPKLRGVVEEGEHRLLDARIVGAGQPGQRGWLILHRLRHASSRLEVVHPGDGTLLGRVPLPWPITVTGLSGGRRDDTLHLGVGSFTAPDRLLACHLPELTTQEVWRPDGGTSGSGAAVAGQHASGDAAVGHESGAAADEGASASTVLVEQVHVHHDGVAVPLFLVHRPDVTPDGARPTVLWGYGGFDIPVTPMHRPGWRAWVEAGGLLAVACLRGGGEYGRAWHDDGRLAHKTNVFADALACAAWLTGRRRDEVTATALSPEADPAAVWSAPGHLGIEGRSNGGLLVGACLTREPAAFGSAVPEVGVLDMVRFHRFTIGWAWTSDYGSPDDQGDLTVLLGYSPYHNAEVGRRYPATLVTTGDTDDRVVPAHSFKFAAALQHAQAGPAPILLRVDRSAGHGAGKPISKLLEERADVLAFHAAHLGLDVGDVGADGAAPAAVS